MASGTDSALHVVHVVSTVPELPYPRASARERSEALLERKRLGGLKLLDDRVRWMEELLVGSIAASHYREGRPEKEVVRLGKELDAGLILSGGRWRPWFERIFGAGFSEKSFAPDGSSGPRGERAGFAALNRTEVASYPSLQRMAGAVPAALVACGSRTPTLPWSKPRRPGSGMNGRLVRGSTYPVVLAARRAPGRAERSLRWCVQGRG